MPYSLNLSARTAQVVEELERALNAPGHDLAPAALAIARVEYPLLDAAPYMEQLQRMSVQAAARIAAAGRSLEDAVGAFNEFFYDESGFCGNRERYDDPRNSFINEVMDRRTGIPISLAIVYLEVARRAGLRVEGVNFPGHFLLRAPAPHAAGERHGSGDLIIDPFHGGVLLSEVESRRLLREHVGEEAAFDAALLAPATRHDIVVRTLVNLKRLYVRMRSFPQARFISTLLLATDPSAVSELRDRGLLAYHLQDFAAALKDLEEYLRLAPKAAPDSPPHEIVAESDDDADEAHGEEDDATQIWEHVKTLRKRVAGFN